MIESELECSCDKYNQINLFDFSKELNVENERREGLISATTCLATVILAIPIFIANSIEAKKYREINLN